MATDADEVAAISDRIREALRCPVCMELKADRACYCGNGHLLCRACVARLLSAAGGADPCPMCRSRPARDDLNGRLTAARIGAVLPLVNVACTYREHGCGAVVCVPEAAGHEAACAYRPDAACLVPGCRWLGARGRLHAHVDDRHPGAVARARGRRLAVPGDVGRLSAAGPRAYLVRTGRDGGLLLWVLVSRASRNRVRAGVFAAPSARPDRDDDHDTELVYRVSFPAPAADRQGRRHRSRAYTRPVGRWHSSLEDDASGRASDPATAASFVRFWGGHSRVVISWFARGRR